MTKKNDVVIARFPGRGVDTAWIEDDGRLIVEWLEWRSESDEDNGVPYDHSDTIAFDSAAQSRLAKALDLPEGDRTGDRLLAEIEKRFSNWFEVRQFATDNGIPFEKHVDFWP